MSLANAKQSQVENLVHLNSPLIHVFICSCISHMLLCTSLKLPHICGLPSMYAGSPVLTALCHQLLLRSAVIHHYQSSTQSNHVPASQPQSQHSRIADSNSFPTKSSASLHQQSTPCSNHRADKLATAAQPAKEVFADHTTGHCTLIQLSSIPLCVALFLR